MAKTKYSNNAQTTLASAITASAASLSVIAGGGSLFPALSTGQYFRATLVQAGNANVYEIIKVTARSSDSMTIVRAQEGTTARSWSAGDYLVLMLTAADMGDAVQNDDLQAQGGNFSYDTGTANAYSVTLNPPLTAHSVGTPIRWIAGHTNTGASTFNDGAGTAPLVLPGGGALIAGQIVAGGMYTAIFDGTNFQIPEIPTNLNSLFQSIVNAVYPVGAYALWENDTITPAATFTWQTWVEVQGVVLVGRQPSTPAFATTGLTGGEVSHTLVKTEVPPLPYQDAYHCDIGTIAQPADQTINIGALNHSIGSYQVDYDNNTVWYRNANTLSGTKGDGTGGATAHNNLQPYRVIRMWRRTA